MDQRANDADAFLAAHPDIRHVDAFLIDLSGKAFGKRYPAADLPELLTAGSSMCAAMQLTDVNGVCWDTAGLGFSDGDPDAPVIAIPGTLAPVPWASEPRAQVMMRFWDGGPLWYEPRSVLERVAARFAELRLTPVAAVELEFYLIDAARTAEGGPLPPAAPGSGRRPHAGAVFSMEELERFGPVVDAIEAACRAQGLPVTTVAKEYGPGQYEINLAHRADAVAAADHAALMRRAVVATTRAQGYDATFMSKPYPGESGSGLQINLSFLDETGANAFDPRRPDGDRRLGAAVAGMQAMLAETMALFAPTFHAFRRFEPDQFTPVTRDWGENNRSVAFRVPASTPENRRIEHRAAGAEANPYLAMAAVLAAAHHGLAADLTPTAMAEGNAGAEADPDLPLKIWSALDRMAAARRLPDYFEPRYIEAYVHARRAELDAFLAEILPREHHWHL